MIVDIDEWARHHREARILTVATEAAADEAVDTSDCAITSEPVAPLAPDRRRRSLPSGRDDVYRG